MSLLFYVTAIKMEAFWLPALLRRQDNWCCTKWGSRAAEPFMENVKFKQAFFSYSAKPFGAGDAFLGNVLARLSHDADIRGAVIQGSALLLLLWPGQAVRLPCQISSSSISS